MHSAETTACARLTLATTVLASAIACAAGAAPALPTCKSAKAAAHDIPVAAAPGNATTYYVRVDGGDARQCTGRANAAYSGRGNAQACAWKHPGIALPPSGAPRIAGGDILRIASGTYRIGDDGYLQAVPSGPSAASPTRILGSAGAVPKLVGTHGIHRVLNLDGSSNIEIGNLEITDGSDCVFKHANARAACDDSMPWARVGLYARGSKNVWLHDVNIHGMAARGMNAGGLADWTIERVKLNRNGSAGWDTNVGAGSFNTGRIVLRHVEIAWNGCGERVSSGEPWACWAQKTGGYGDGLGTTDTGGQWLVEDAYVHHNTSDGLDFRYMDGAPSTRVTMRRVYAVANAGNQVKIKGNSLVENSVLVGYCSYFRNRFFMTDADLCRADGSTLQLVMTGNDTAIVRNNTLAGEGATQIGHSEGDGSDTIRIRDNLVIGFPYHARPAKASAFDGGKSKARIDYSGNVAWKVAACPQDTICSKDPKLANMTLAAFNAKPLTGSPVAGKAGATACDN
jgi:hypothetical protein